MREDLSVEELEKEIPRWKQPLGGEYGEIPTVDDVLTWRRRALGAAASKAAEEQVRRVAKEALAVAVEARPLGAPAGRAAQDRDSAASATRALSAARARLATETERSSATLQVLQQSSSTLAGTHARQADLSVSLDRGKAARTAYDSKDVAEFRRFVAAAIFFILCCVYILMDRVFRWTPLNLIF